MDSGMNHFLSKPIRRPALKQVLKTYCTTIIEEPESQTASPPPASPHNNDSFGTTFAKADNVALTNGTPSVKSEQPV